MNDNKNDNRQPNDHRRPLPPDTESPLPLAEEIEDAMLDRDIPVETGVRPVRK